jgi:hypothetical protein
MFDSLTGTMEPPHISAAGTLDWSLSLAGVARTQISSQHHDVVTVTDFLSDPYHAVESANLHNFAVITPHYPGVRAPLESETCTLWQKSLADLLSDTFGAPPSRWEMQAWYSLVTTPPARLTPLQCFPHVDGTDPQQIAMMLYLHEGAHGGTAFFRHRSTGLEALTAETFPAYRAALEADVARSGLPPPAYPTDGAPHFERIHATSGAFNSAVFYRGNILHTGVIDNAAPLSDDPRIGRLTINAFFRPL